MLSRNHLSVPERLGGGKVSKVIRAHEVKKMQNAETGELSGESAREWARVRENVK